VTAACTAQLQQPLSTDCICWLVLQLVAGLLGPSTNWRLPFLVMATPTLLLTALLLFTVKEPPRGGECSRCCVVRGQSLLLWEVEVGAVQQLVLWPLHTLQAGAVCARPGAVGFASLVCLTGGHCQRGMLLLQVTGDNTSIPSPQNPHPPSVPNTTHT
jgi:MFS family permease